MRPTRPTASRTRASFVTEDKVDIIVRLGGHAGRRGDGRRRPPKSQTVQIMFSPAALPPGKDALDLPPAAVDRGDGPRDGRAHEEARRQDRRLPRLHRRLRRELAERTSSRSPSRPASSSSTPSASPAPTPASPARRSSSSAANPDAILVVASGSGAAMPHKGLVERGYKGKIYQTHAAATRDLMRVGGKDVDGTFVVVRPGGDRRAAARQPPVARSSRIDFVQKYEKAYGTGSAQPVRRATPTTSSSCCEKVVPGRAEEGQAGHAGVPRRAQGRARDDGPHRVSHGVLNWTKNDHWGFTHRDRRDAEGGQRRLEVVRRDAAAPRLTAARRPAVEPARRRNPRMDFSIAGILMLDGVTNGAVYALLALATVLVFAVTRVIFIPQGEFVAYGALTLALLQLGKVPGHASGCCSPLAAARRAALDIVDAAARAACAPASDRARRWRDTLALPVRRARGRAGGPRRASCPLAVQSAADAGDRHAARAAGLPARLPAARRRDRAGAADRLGRRALRADRPRASCSSAPRAFATRASGTRASRLGAAHAVGPDADHLHRPRSR